MSQELKEDAYFTHDGSLTLKDDETGELYHNRAGAYTEALANFVEPLNLPTFKDETGQLAFLDVCFGLGYNTFCLLSELAKNNLQADSIKIVAIEKFQKPLLYLGRVLEDERFRGLNQCILSQTPELAEGQFGSWKFMLGCGQRQIPVHFELLEVDLRQAVPRLASEMPGVFDGIFHDPFSARRAPEFWTVDLFSCYAQLLKQPNGKVVTYSAASAVRSAFQMCGLVVRRTTAVGEKHGGTLAMRPNVLRLHECGMPLLEEEQAKLAGRAGVPYRDKQFCKTSREILQQREQEQRELFPW